MENLKIGSHVSMAGPQMLLNAVKEALNYNENTFMIYTGAPQNTKRKELCEFNLQPSLELMLKNNMVSKDIVIHAPYIINLGNTLKKHIFDLGVDFLKKEIFRSEYIGASNIILHPGSHIKQGDRKGLDSIIEGLNKVITAEQKIFISLETMAGKGSECGCSFEQLQYIISGVNYKEKIKICFDTCHVWDSGYDIVNNYNKVMNEFDRIIGLDKIGVLHINDSKNICGSKKDRHENIGFGYIGFDALIRIIYDERFKHIPKILETPYIDKKFPPYKQEIKMIRDKKFNPNLREEILEENL